MDVSHHPDDLHIKLSLTNFFVGFYRSIQILLSMSSQRLVLEVVGIVKHILCTTEERVLLCLLANTTSEASPQVRCRFQEFLSGLVLPRTLNNLLPAAANSREVKTLSVPQKQ